MIPEGAEIRILANNADEYFVKRLRDKKKESILDGAEQSDNASS